MHATRSDDWHRLVAWYWYLCNSELTSESLRSLQGIDKSTVAHSNLHMSTSILAILNGCFITAKEEVIYFAFILNVMLDLLF